MLQGGARTFQDCETFEREIVDHCILSFFSCQTRHAPISSHVVSAFGIFATLSLFLTSSTGWQCLMGPSGQQGSDLRR